MSDDDLILSEQGDAPAPPAAGTDDDLILSGSGDDNVPQPPLPSDLLNAIKQHFAASALAALVNNIYLNEGSRRQPPPYVLVSETGATLKLITSTLQVHETRVRFKLYAEGAEAAGGLGDQLEDLFTDARLQFANGWAARWVRSERRHAKDDGLSRPGNEVWYLMVEFTTKVKR